MPLDPGTGFDHVVLLILTIMQVLLISSVVIEGRARHEPVLGWAILVFFLPFLGYALWRASMNASDAQGSSHEEFQIFMNGRRRRR